MLTHAVNLGYDELLNQVITHVQVPIACFAHADGTLQGKKVSSLHHLAHEIETSTADSIEIRTSENILILIPVCCCTRFLLASEGPQGPRNPAAHEANEKITARYRVTADRSLDLRTPYNPARANSSAFLPQLCQAHHCSFCRHHRAGAEAQVRSPPPRPASHHAAPALTGRLPEARADTNLPGAHESQRRGVSIGHPSRVPLEDGAWYVWPLGTYAKAIYTASCLYRGGEATRW